MAGTPRNFGEFARAIAALAKVPASVSRSGAVEIQRMMRKDFAAGRDAYGRAYAPLRPASLDRGRRPPPLRKYGRTATAAPLAGSGITISQSHPQAGFHQTGTSRMAKRVVIPDGTLPATWRAAIKAQFGAKVRKTMGRAA